MQISNKKVRFSAQPGQFNAAHPLPERTIFFDADASVKTRELVPSALGVAAKSALKPSSKAITDRAPLAAMPVAAQAQKPKSKLAKLLHLTRSTKPEKSAAGKAMAPYNAKRLKQLEEYDLIDDYFAFKIDSDLPAWFGREQGLGNFNSRAAAYKIASSVDEADYAYLDLKKTKMRSVPPPLTTLPLRFFRANLSDNNITHLPAKLFTSPYLARVAVAQQNIEFFGHTETGETSLGKLLLANNPIVANLDELPASGVPSFFAAYFARLEQQHEGGLR